MTENAGRTLAHRDNSGRFNSEPRVIPDLRASPSLAYLLGAIKGDGSFNFSEHRVRLRVADKLFADKFASELRNIGMHPGTGLIPPPRPNWSIQHYVGSSSKAFASWYRSISNAQLSDIVNTTPETVKAFIAGFFDAEGGIFTKTRNRIYEGYKWTEHVHIIHFTNTDLTLLSLTQTLLERLGYSFNLIIRTEARGNRQTCYGLRTYRADQFRRFLDEIPATKCERRKFNYECS